MSEDGELSESPNTGAIAEDLNDSFVIDRTHSIIIPDNENDDNDVVVVVEETKTTVETTVIVDTVVGEEPPVKAEGSSEWQKQMRKRLFGEPVDTSEEPPNKRRRPANLCFNCRGDHSIAQCPEPKDFAAIRKNKSEFLAEKQQNQGRISKVESEKETKFRPGRLSQSLRNALNLGPDDIPEWIYRMRIMGFQRGYPPGYLRKSLKHEFGALKIYSDDVAKKPKEDVDEEERPPPSIQKERIHFYMGFNKTYGALRDRERGRFQVPPFDTFCDMLQEEVTKDHKYSEKNRRRDEKARREELEKIREQRKSEEPEEKEEEAVVEPTPQTPRPKETTPEPQGKMGESIHQFVGTPIISRRNESGVWIDATTPTLEAFSVGIVPFEAKEEEKPSGFFKKIMSTLRGDSAKKEGGDGEDS